MKNIWIDGFEANVKQRVGSGQVAYELLRNIEKIDHINNYTILLAGAPLEDLPRAREGFKYKIIRPSRLKTLVSIPWALYKSKERPDLFFSPTHYIPRFIPKGIKRVVMIFDLAYLRFPEMFTKKDLYQLTNWTKFSIQNADKIITISKSTKKDIMDFYNVNSDEIKIAYPGYDESIYKPVNDSAKISEVLQKYNIDTKISYVVYVGTLQPRKNLVRLIESIRKIENFQLVIVGKTTGFGKQGWMYQEILETPKKLGIEDKVIFTGFVPSEELRFLIAGAKALAFPSLWEGFGIPVVEAMACGTPAIVSNVSSLPEAVGDAGLLVNPKSTDQIEHAIRLMVSDKKLQLKLAKKSLEQAKKFSWKKMATEVIKTWEEI